MMDDNELPAWPWVAKPAEIGHAPVVEVHNKPKEVRGHAPRIRIRPKRIRKKTISSLTAADQRREYRKQDNAFVAAMVNAIRHGLERPPRVGIDETPCTSNPVFVPHGGNHAPVEVRSKDGF